MYADDMHYYFGFAGDTPMTLIVKNNILLFFCLEKVNECKFFLT